MGSVTLILGEPMTPVSRAQSTPAVIFCPPETAGLEIAGLTLLDRLIVAIHRGGAGAITLITAGVLPRLERTLALGIQFKIGTECPKTDGPVLLASANLLVQDRDVRRCVTEGARLLSSSGKPLPIGLSTATGTAIAHLLEPIPKLRADGVALLVTDPPEAQAAERELWASLTSRSDGFVDRIFNRPFGRPVSKLLARTGASPNTISIASILVGVVSAFLFAQMNYWANLVGAILFQLSAVLDCVDGDIARILYKESRFGKWLDLTGDQVVHVAVFAGIAMGVSKAGAAGQALWLGLSAVIGALISFAVVVRGIQRPSGASPRLQRLIDAATNRDFSVLVLALACLQQLNLFLWMAAVGTHLFWTAALSLQSGTRAPRRLNQ